MEKVPTRGQRLQFRQMTELIPIKRQPYSVMEKVTVLRLYEKSLQYRNPSWFVKTYNKTRETENQGCVTKHPLPLNTFRRWLKSRDKLLELVKCEHPLRKRQPNGRKKKAGPAAATSC
jgi:hypothetical protein